MGSKMLALMLVWFIGADNAPEEPKHTPVRSPSDHWAFQPVIRSAVPPAKNTAWVRNPIDAFILARLEQEGIEPSPVAGRVTLIRRVSLDLLGLLPTVEQVDEFLADTRPDAYERLVKRLLQSPHYGERWARHWMDLARYADSNGYTIDSARSIWKYRDWIIGALNRDLPFDQFTIEQMAGDMLPDATTDQIIATGFHRNTLINEEGGTDKEQFRVEAVVDRLSTTGVVFLGLTVGCARCHDHKYDPISQREYYQLFSFFNNADEPKLPLPSPEQARKLAQLKRELVQARKRLQEYDAQQSARQVQWERELAAAGDVTAVPAEIRQILAVASDQRTGEQRERLGAAFRKRDPVRRALAERAAALRKQQQDFSKSIPATMVMRQRETPRETHIHIRGDFLRKGQRVQPDVPAVFPPFPADVKEPTRLDLARWLVDPGNPLTARVTVNRFWLTFFGKGLVETENDFGTRGERPTHPKLLDWLASEFVARGWRVKEVHRLIVTSATYRQSSRVRLELGQVDPRNRLLARQNRLRLEAETIRDVALGAGGLLSRKIGGRSVFPPQPEGIYRFTQNVKPWKVSEGSGRFRRGMYTFFWRSSPYPFLTTFDAPDANTSCTRRVRSNTPLQALTLANDPAFVEIAQGLASRVLREAPADNTGRITYAFRLCLARAPTDRELAVLKQFLLAQLSEFQAAPQQSARAAPKERLQGISASDAAAWTALARVLLNLDEFITRG